MEASLPRDAYCDDGVFDREQQRVLGRSWVCIGRDDDVAAAPGSYRVCVVAGESVVVIRHEHGTLGAFANRCAHRGTELFDDDNTVGCVGSTVRCPYHLWTYDTDGQLRNAPWIDGVVGDPAFNLHRYDVDSWGGFVFVRIEPTGPSLAESLGPVAARVAQYPLADLCVGAVIDYEVAANWKVIAENYNECYHCGPVHPELCELVPSFRLRGGGTLDWDAGVPHRPGAYTYTTTGTTRRQPFAGLDDVHRANHFGELIYPNLMLSLSCDHAAAFVLQPRTAARTDVRCLFLFDPDETRRDGFDPSDAVEFWDVVNRQDWAICARVQRGMTSRTFVHGWYAPMEDPSLDIRRWWTSFGMSVLP